MEKREHNIEYFIYEENELSSEDSVLISKAKEAMKRSYAPYSKFNVGCALLLENGEIIMSGNQENVSSPAGICAERSGLSAASSRFPETPVKKIAIATVADEETLTTPCGICRQSLMEYEMRFDQNIAILLRRKDNIYYFESIRSLLPFPFNNYILKHKTDI